jgi:hypothetical protein
MSNYEYGTHKYDVNGRNDESYGRISKFQEALK